jgi:hypothetical protein
LCSASGRNQPSQGPVNSTAPPGNCRTTDKPLGDPTPAMLGQPRTALDGRPACSSRLALPIRHWTSPPTNLAASATTQFSGLGAPASRFIGLLRKLQEVARELDGRLCLGGPSPQSGMVGRSTLLLLIANLRSMGEPRRSAHRRLGLIRRSFGRSTWQGVGSALDAESVLPPPNPGYLCLRTRPGWTDKR